MAQGHKHFVGIAALMTALGLPPGVHAVIFDVTIDGSDAIFLAGRTDVAIPAANLSWGPAFPTMPSGELQRHVAATPEEILETLPPIIPVAAGDVIRVADPAVGGINLFNGFGPPFFGPDGNGVDGSDLVALDGISGYEGPEGPLTGVFLDASIPDGTDPTPMTLDFTAGGLGREFATLSPALRQVFYIGDGITSGGISRPSSRPPGRLAWRSVFRTALPSTAIPAPMTTTTAPIACASGSTRFRLRSPAPSLCLAWPSRGLPSVGDGHAETHNETPAQLRKDSRRRDGWGARGVSVDVLEEGRNGGPKPTSHSAT